jgi:O-antigen/teichoic acid export membrane protein
MAESGAPLVGLSGGRALVRNTGWNLVGYLAPLAAGVVALPLLIDALGVARFGVLTLAWAVIGYFGLLDLGIGRATTKYVAEYLADGRDEGLRALVWTSIAMLGALGMIGGVVLAALTPTLVRHVLKIPADLANETVGVFYVLAVGLPAVLVTPGARAVLEAQQRFATVNLVKAPANVALFLAPLAVLPFSHNLVAIVAVLVATRYVVLVIYARLALRSLPAAVGAAPTWGHVRIVAPFAGWTALNNGLGSLMAMGYLDRFLITGLLSVQQAAYYATGFEVVNRLWFFPTGLLLVVFPTFSALARDARALGMVHRRAMRYVWLMLMAPTIVLIACAHPLIGVWLGETFARESTLVLQLLAAGLFLNSLAQVGFALVQAVGRPDLTAKRHVLELPVYVVLMLVAIPAAGIDGAAAVWLTWAGVDAAILLVLVHRLVPGAIQRADLLRLYGWAVLLLALAFATGRASGTAANVILGTLVVGLAGIVGFLVVLEPGERRSLRRQLRVPELRRRATPR